ncbi:MAG: 50S ribosomal protein L9, partial [Enterococcus sp.]|nr:50S ribosomal protein L9 [Enterococcus sp.]
MATEPNYKKINEDKRKAELSKREDELKRLEKLEQQLSRY